MTTIDIIQMLDITEPDNVEILIDAKKGKLWVNVDGICRLRACRIRNITATKTIDSVLDEPCYMQMDIE